ncbi:CDP-glycerol--glycerophosphate glycerophosphotransferase [Candidatus Woesearchaeota archaeon]|nr:CDP-glycerol--glycerophosphate glycerophosphotransferase [Candidatus Woesearchaeota archaeon]
MKLSNFLREVKDFFRFFLKTPKSHKNIVFYSENAGYYPYFEGIINELLQRNQPFSYVTSDSADPILKTTKNIKPFYIGKLLTIFFSLVNCKVFVITLTDLNQFHLKRSTHPVHYVYVFHSLLSTHMAFRAGSFDHYDSLLCPGSQQLKEIKKREEVYNLPKKELLEAGYYRLERIHEAYKKYKKKDETRTVLIAPSWGDKNIIESCGEKLIKLILNANYHVILRPHPETIKHNPQIIESLEKLYSTNPNFELEKSVRTDDSLLKADVLICDYSGIALEYAFGTERPVLFLDVPKKIKNPDYEKLGIEPLELALRSKIGIVVSPEQLEKISDAIATLIRTTDSYKNRITTLRNTYIYSFGKSSQVSAQHILSTCQKKETTQ